MELGLALFLSLLAAWLERSIDCCPPSASGSRCCQFEVGLPSIPSSSSSSSLDSMTLDWGSMDPSPSSLPAKRITYLLAAPASPLPRLELPDLGAGRHPSRATKGSSNPLIKVASQQQQTSSHNITDHAEHPRHSLQVTSLAIDNSTAVLGDDLVDGQPSPRGLLYTGGRDGLAASWSLNLRMKKRQPNESTRGDDEDGSWDDGEDQTGAFGELQEDGIESEEWETLPHDRQWQIDGEWLSNTKSLPGKTTFRSCVQSHTDWINDMVLCNTNQTVVTASADRFIRAWNPNDPASCLSPSIVGSHTDYVKALAVPDLSPWIASAGFDQTVRLWDLGSVGAEPVVTIRDSASIYTVATDALGSLLAVGGPDNGVRLYDPRTSSNASGPVSQLLGHTDMIRTIRLSKSGRTLLSGSSDGSVRLWDVGEGRCVHTMTHHNSSVTSLWSANDELEIFYSADKDGYLCKVDTEDCIEPEDGECIVVAKSDSAITNIAGLDNELLWTCGFESDVECWRDVPTRRARQALYPISFEHPAMSEDSPITPQGWTKFENGVAASPAADPVTTSKSPLQSALKSHLSHLSSSPAQTPSIAGHSRVSFTLDRQPMGSRFASSLSGHSATDASESQSRLRSSQSVAAAPLVLGVDPAATLFGIPFDSMVSLSTDQDGLGRGTSLGPTAAGATGAGSVMSFRGSVVHLSSGEGPLGRRGSSFSVGGRNSFAFEGMLPGSAANPGPTMIRLSHMKQKVDPKQQPTLPSIRPHSIRSHRASSSLKFDSISPTTHFGSYEDLKHGDEGQDGQAARARQAFESRETVTSARPLRMEPHEVIRGTTGLVRSSMLNDRRHVLTFTPAPRLRRREATISSNAGQNRSPVVTLWDILRCQAVGTFQGQELLDLYSPGATPGDLLEEIKQRIEGFGAVQSWCSVDTKNGSLAVHLDSGNCFDAELYLDECEWLTTDEMSHLKDDQRVNLGKWLMKTFFQDLVEVEAALRGEGSNAPLLYPGELAEERPEVVSRILAMSTSSLQGRRGRKGPTMSIPTRLSIDTQQVHTPGNTLAIAVAAKTPALSPRALGPVTPTSRGMPGLASVADQLGSPRASAAPSPSTDYFSLATMKASRPTTPSVAAAAASSAEGPVETLAAPVATPSSLMGRWGAKLTRNKTERQATAGGASTTGVASPSKLPDANERQSTARAGDTAAIAIVRAIVSRPVDQSALAAYPQSLRDSVPTNTALLISTASGSDAGAQWEVVYKGLAGSSIKRDIAALEKHLPWWGLELLLQGRVDALAPPANIWKMAFILVPVGGASSKSADNDELALPALPSGDAKLTATRMLRVRKMASYLCDRLDSSTHHHHHARRKSLSGPGGRRPDAPVHSRQGSIALDGDSRRPSTTNSIHSPTGTPPTGSPATFAGARGMTALSSEPMSMLGSPPSLLPEDIELSCQGQVLDPHLTLAQIQRFYWKVGSVGDVVVEYRRKPRI